MLGAGAVCRLPNMRNPVLKKCYSGTSDLAAGQTKKSSEQPLFNFQLFFAPPVHCHHWWPVRYRRQP
jgi:hypothetical protein